MTQGEVIPREDRVTADSVQPHLKSLLPLLNHRLACTDTTKQPRARMYAQQGCKHKHTSTHHVHRARSHRRTKLLVVVLSREGRDTNAGIFFHQAVVQPRKVFVPPLNLGALHSHGSGVCGGGAQTANKRVNKQTNE